MRWHAFLSYSRQQYHSAESLALQLQDRGLDIWFDVQQLEPGVDWQQSIQGGLDQSGSVLLLASRAALDSPYVEREWRRALELGRPVIVALVEAVRLPGDLRRSPLIDCRGDFEIGVEQVQRAILDPTAPTPPIWPLPRLSPGVARATIALLVGDLHALGLLLTAAAMWILLFQYSSLPRLVTDWGVATLNPSLDNSAREWLLPVSFAGGLLWLFLVQGGGIRDLLSGGIPGLKTVRFLRHDLQETILAQPTRMRMWPVIALGLALASGHLWTVIERYSRRGIEPIPPPLLGIVAISALIWWIFGRVQVRLRPRLPDADLLRWARSDEAPADWRAQVYKGATPAAGLAASKPVWTEASGASLRMRVVVEPADLPVLNSIRPLLLEVGGVIEPEDGAAEYDLLILSHASSRQRVTSAMEGRERILGVIASRFTLPRELEGLGRLQLVDFSRQDHNALRAALRLLTARSDEDRSRLQPYLEPVSLKRAAPPKIAQELASGLLSLFLLTLLVMGLAIWQRDSLADVNATVGALAIIALLLLLSNARARRGRLPMPRPGMIVLVFLPLILLALTTLEIPVLYPQGGIILLGTTAIAVARFLYLFLRHPHTLGGNDIFGMPPMRLRVVAAVYRILIWMGIWIVLVIPKK